MKKLVTPITLKNGERRTVKVYLDDHTYSLLMQTGDQALIEAYVTCEYDARNLERREQRHGTSLEAVIEGGHDYEDKRESPLDATVHTEQREKITAALNALPAMYREVFTLHVLEGYSFSQLAEKFGVSKSRVGMIFQTARKKLMIFLKNR